MLKIRNHKPATGANISIALPTSLRGSDYIITLDKKTGYFDRCHFTQFQNYTNGLACSR